MKLYKIMIGLIMLLSLSGNELFSQEIKVGKVTNEIRVGPLSDNTNLTIGVRNMLEELLMDYGYDLWDKANTQINVRLVFFDIKNTGSNIGIYHNKVSATYIIAIGELQIGDKVKNRVTKKGVSKEVSNSTLVVASDGSFNNQTTSNALRKVLVKIVEDLL